MVVQSREWQDAIRKDFRVRQECKALDENKDICIFTLIGFYGCPDENHTRQIVLGFLLL